MGILRALIVLVVVLAVAFGAYAAVVVPSNGTTRDVRIVAGQGPGGSMFFRCHEQLSSGGVCDPDDPSRVTVDKRDRLRWTVESEQGGGHRHDFHLEGWPYQVWPATARLGLDKAQESTTMTAWMGGSWKFVCGLPGHEAAGMWGTLVVR